MKKLFFLLFIITFSCSAKENSDMTFGDKPIQASFNNELEMVNHMKKFKTQT